MAVSETSLANLALARIGSKRINDLAADASLEAQHCREQYEPTRDALLRSHWWSFALARVVLSEDATIPAFQWAHQFILPSDCLRVVNMYVENPIYEIEGDRLLTDDETAEIIYIWRVTDPTQFDALFVQVLVLQLALRIVMPLSQDKLLRREIEGELERVMARARLVNLQEHDARRFLTWNEARRVNVAGS